MSGIIWTPCCTRPGAERDALREIEDLGIGALLPSYRKVVYRSGRSRLVHRPIFPGYVFAALPANGAGMGEIADLEVISSVLASNRKPRRIMGREAERFNAMALSCLLGDFNVTEHRAANGRFMPKVSKRSLKPRRGKRLRRSANIQQHHDERIHAHSSHAVA
jgi:transcription antitermination factor NusG